MTKTKRPVRGGMKVCAYDVLRRALEEGAEYDWRRAHKHTDSPDAETIKDQIVTTILNEVCEYFDFDDEDRQV
jgi:predicted Zn-dependent protease with MMP-like domain